jgi:hypothetical protein
MSSVLIWGHTRPFQSLWLFTFAEARPEAEEAIHPGRVEEDWVLAQATLMLASISKRGRPGLRAAGDVWCRAFREID